MAIKYDNDIAVDIIYLNLKKLFLVGPYTVNSSEKILDLSAY